MTGDSYQRQSGGKRRIQSWHAPEPRERALAVFVPDARTRQLARLVPLWPSEIESTDPADAERLVSMLERALRGERRRGRAGHWSYDMNRHAALARVLQEEHARLASLRSAATNRTGQPLEPQANGIEIKSRPLEPI